MRQGHGRALMIGGGIVASLALALAGCTGGNQTKTEKSPTQTAGGPTNGAKGQEVSLQKVKIDKVEDHVKSQKGKVVVMDFWNFT